LGDRRSNQVNNGNEKISRDSIGAVDFGKRVIQKDTVDGKKTVKKKSAPGGGFF